MSKVRSRLNESVNADALRSPGDTLSTARNTCVGHLSSDPGLVSQLKQLHDLVLSVCPDCLVMKRGDHGVIYVPPERQYEFRNKNLLTMWAKDSGVRMRIMPNPEEMYAPGKQAEYLRRLQDLLNKILSLSK